MHTHTMTDVPPSQVFSCLQDFFGENTEDTRLPDMSQNVHCTDQWLFFMHHYNLLSACQLNRIRNSGGKLTVRANGAPKHFHGNCPWDKKDEAENKMNNKKNWFHMVFFKAKCQLASEINKACYILIIILPVACKNWSWVLSVILISFTIQ